jgi:signal transduction histidine kinase
MEARIEAEARPPGRKRTVLAWGLFGAIAATLGLAFVFAVGSGSVGDDVFGILFGAATILCYAAVGAVIAARAPRNPIGWLILAVALAFEFGVLNEEITRRLVQSGSSDSPLFDVAVWLQTWLFFAVAALPLVLVLFPDGRPPSPRWRLLVWVIVGASALGAIAAMITPGVVPISEDLEPENPLGIQALEGPLRTIGSAVGIVMIGCILASVVAVIVRWRRARGVERQQMRLLVSVVILAVATYALLIVIGEGGSDELANFLFAATFVIVGVGIPIAIGAAVLRYRMYDIEIVIRKTIRFAVVAVLIAGAIAFILLLVGGPLVGRVIGDEPGPAAVILGVLLGLLLLPLWRVSRRIADRIVFGGRATPYEVLTEFSQRMGESYATDDVLPRMAAVLGNAVGGERADVWLGAGAGRRRAAGWPDGDGPADPGPEAIPVSYQGEELGALSVVMPADDPMDDAKRALIHDLAGQAGPVLHNVRLLEDLRDSRRRIVSAQDERARKLERDIHDGVQQQVVALAVKLRLADQLVDRDPAKAHEALAGLQTDAGQALDDLRDLARGIYPPLLADQGLEAALTAQARKGAVPITVRADGLGRYPREVESAVYFCTLEALNNAAKYAQAGSVQIALAQVDGHLTFTVADDGRGFDPAVTTYGTGLQGMHDRLDAVGGSLRIEAAPDDGVRVTGRLPVRTQA